MTVPKLELEPSVWKLAGGSDTDWYCAVLAAYDALPTNDKVRIMRLAKQLETGIHDMGRKGALALLAAIGIAMEEQE